MPFDRYGYDRRGTLRASNMGGTLQKTDRILTGNSRITVRVAPSTKATHSISDAIQIGTKGLDLGNTKDVLAVMGQNYHEVSHVLFTPMLTPSELTWTRLNANGQSERVELHPAFNFLEEARIETLFSAQYPKAKHFFTVMVSKLLLGKYETPDGVMDLNAAIGLGYTHEQSHAIFTHLLVYGRRYLPSDIREAVREYAEDVLGTDPAEMQKIEDAEAIVDEYRLLPTSKIASRGRELTILLTSLYPNFFEAVSNKEAADSGDQHNPLGSGASSAAQAAYGRRSSSATAASKEQQDEAAEKAQQDEEDGYEEIELSDDSEGDSGDDDEANDDEGSGTGDASDEESDEDDDADGEGDGDEGEEDDEDDSPSGRSSGSDSDEEEDEEDGEGGGGDSDEGDGGDAAGRSSGSSGINDSSTLRDILEGITATVAKDSRIRRDVDDIMDVMDSPQERADDTYVAQKRPATPDEQETGRRLAKEFERLAQDVSPGWNYGSDTGRLNVNRAMLPDADFEQVFDEWDEGREQDAGVEMVFLLDMSGSMSGFRIQNASSFAWTICEALKEVDAKITVYGFSDEGEVYTLKGRDDPHTHEVREYGDVGGTSPAFALNAARALLAQSELPNRVLVVATDGMWAANVYEPGGKGMWYNDEKVADTYRPLLESIPAHKTLIGIGQVGMGQGGQFDRLGALFDVTAQVNAVTELTEPILKTIEGMVRQHLHA